MPKRISQYDLAGPLTGAEQFVLVQNSRTKRTTLDEIREEVDSSCQCTLVSRSRSSSTGANLLETFFETWQMPPNTMVSDNTWLEIFAFGTFANNSNAKTLKLYFGSTVIYTALQSGAVVSAVWEIRAKVIRNTVNIQKAISVCDFISGGRNQLTFPTENLSLAIPIAISGTNGVANAGDINCEGFIIRLNKMDADS